MSVDYGRFAEAWPGETHLLYGPFSGRMTMSSLGYATAPSGLLVALHSVWYRAVCFVKTDATATRLAAGELQHGLSEEWIEAARAGGLPLMLMIRELSTGVFLAAPELELPHPRLSQVTPGEVLRFYPRAAFQPLPVPANR